MFDYLPQLKNVLVFFSTTSPLTGADCGRLWQQLTEMQQLRHETQACTGLSALAGDVGDARPNVIY